MRKLLILVLPALMAQSQPPLVPEGVHSDVEGPPELCGFTGSDVADLQRQVLASPGFVEEGSTNLYQVFNRAKDFVQFVFPQPGTLAFPMATCRKVIENSDGSILMKGEMHCDGSRDECDRVFLQFQELDEQVRRSLNSSDPVV